MKKVIIFISSLLVSAFLYFSISASTSQLIFSSFPAVDLYYVSDEVDKVNFEDRLTELANENGVAIAKRIVIPQENGNPNFYYKAFGDKKLPAYLRMADDDVLRVNDDLAATYIIVGDGLSQEELDGYLSKGENQTRIFSSGNSMENVLVLFSYPAIIVTILVSYLILLSVSTMKNMNDASKYGIELVSGVSKGRIFLNLIKYDFFGIVLAFLANLIIFSLLFKIEDILIMPIFKYFSLSLAFYLGAMLLLVIILNLIFVFMFKYHNLINIIKGKLPIKSLMTLLIVLQMLSFFIVSHQMDAVAFSYPQIKKLETSSTKWDEYPNLVNIVFNLNADTDLFDENLKRMKMWYDFLAVAYENKGFFLAYNNIDQYFGAKLEEAREKTSSYDADGNTLIVTPNYLEYENIKLMDTDDDFSDLALGEFALILPNKLKNDGQSYINKYQAYVDQTFYSDNGIKSKAKVAYLEDNKERFIFNTTIVSDKQYFNDPILLVITPQSTGDSDNSLFFWQNVINNFVFFKDYEKAHELLEKENLIQWVSYLNNSRNDYKQRLANELRDIKLNFISGIFAIISSILLFNSIVLTYFEEFRRDIFIKKISGLDFFENHLTFILLQFIVLIISFFGSYIFVYNKKVILLTLLIFAVNALIILFIQNKIENKQSVSILKGE